jgi:uncharacterized membrane protein
MNSVADRTSYPPLHLHVRSVSWLSPFRWLARAMVDLRRSLRASCAHGLLMVLLGWLLLLVIGTHPYFVAAAVTGFLLVAPVMTTGVCELTRRLHSGEPITFNDSLTPLQRNHHALLGFGGRLALVAIAWFVISTIMLEAIFRIPAPSLAETYYRGFADTLTAPQLMAYTAIGGVLALVVFAMSIVAVPLIIDRHASASQAVRASFEVLRTNPVTMVIWAALIVALTAIGFATFLVGMIVIIPLLGHATWRAYRDLVRT